MSMYEEGIVVHEELQSAFGRGACVSLHLHSSDTENLKSGTYHFGTESKEFTLKDFTLLIMNLEEISLFMQRLAMEK